MFAIHRFEKSVRRMTLTLQFGLVLILLGIFRRAEFNVPLYLPLAELPILLRSSEQDNV